MGELLLLKFELKWQCFSRTQRLNHLKDLQKCFGTLSRSIWLRISSKNGSLLGLKSPRELPLAREVTFSMLKSEPHQHFLQDLNQLNPPQDL